MPMFINWAYIRKFNQIHMEEIQPTDVKKFFRKHFGKNEGKWIASITRKRLMYNPSRLHPARDGTKESNDRHANSCVHIR